MSFKNLKYNLKKLKLQKQPSFVLLEIAFVHFLEIYFIFY